MSIQDISSMKNKQQLELILTGILLIIAAVIMLFVYPVYATIAIPAPFFILIALTVMPYKICFDEEGLTLCYVFLKNERYLWSNIDYIEAEPHGSGKYMYVIHEKAPRKQSRFKQRKFPKRRKSEVALGIYYTGKIEDEQRDGIPWR